MRGATTVCIGAGGGITDLRAEKEAEGNQVKVSHNSLGAHLSLTHFFFNLIIKIYSKTSL